MYRPPYVAGSFYPRDRSSLLKMIEKFIDDAKKDIEFIDEGDNVGVLCPHAGYVYSGKTQAHSYYYLSNSPPETYVILGPNHTGMGLPVALMNEGTWETPLGEVNINQELASKIVERSGIVGIDSAAHKYEHSIEVQLPFLQYLKKDLTFVPICMGMQDMQTAIEIGKAIAKSSEESLGVIASSDLVHFGNRFDYSPIKGSKEEVLSWIKKNDMEILKMAENFDVQGIYKFINKNDYTTCGYGPLSVMLTCMKELGAKKGKILDYSNSYEASGDYSAVVGYGSVGIKC
ncbi:MAG TPA: MEMO1 family protein [Methanofastidiosum sp.]|nr:MEMO1 family protein [Methanofastidiosum sp.]HOC77211.1 MEMO1 family protein [Methanofastidiosum sp.]HQK63280.1 MEMO1 family protein [Methanofastidiosum sp.]HQQ49285.1 MEMO1 family protein [Methanofastidiosum sp.]